MHPRGPKLTSCRPFAAAVLLLWPALHPSAAQVPAASADPRQAMEKAEHLVDIYNWYDAHPYYMEAERMFLAQGDERNALFARASRLRGEMQILPFPDLIDAIDKILSTDIAKNDPALRLRCFIIRGDVNLEIDAPAAKDALLPAFHPPPGHIRSRSMLMPILMRRSRSAVRLRPRVLDCRSAIRLKAVGMAQLVVPGTQLHPYFAGSNPTRLSTVWNFQRQNQFASRPFASINQWIADARPAVSRPTFMRVIAARAVTQQPVCSSPAKAGQLPSLFCRSTKVRNVKPGLVV